ncbi:DUF2500 domain-containing protein [Lederbergia panacisoli]|uniref:DUF2500 domain-containing protein n=1 Tax=Lederbergia panacisoli TaxID=1255251 RepID=UPI00214CFB08|nr:DUF2500 domain-containing protein [Lederbergia panacisoli]MCR2822715.1 DUF2500 domain-containing protein [Lederbergia panacisoli]
MEEVYFSGFNNAMFDIVPTFIGIIFFVIITMIIISIVKGISQWQKNEQSPRLSVPALVKTKRAKVSRHNHMNGNDFHPHHTNTSYFVTFEFESGDRSELKVSGKEYGLLAEGDIGILTFQGTRYLGFERNLN